MKLIYKSFNLHGIMELIYEFIRLVLQSIKPIYQSTPLSTSRFLTSVSLVVMIL